MPEESIQPEQVARCLKSLFVFGGPSAVQIQTHYGALPLNVREIWEADGVLHISVLVPETP
jgi:hypothetical protein